MKTYYDYKSEAEALLQKEYGNNTVELVTQTRNNLQLVIQSIIMIDLINKLTEEKPLPAKEIVEEVKPATKKGK